jgi:hypothetical protein
LWPVVLERHQERQPEMLVSYEMLCAVCCWLANGRLLPYLGPSLVRNEEADRIMLQNVYKRSPVLALAGLLLVSGCASSVPNGSSTGGTAVDRANANFTGTVATGALTGAVIGGVAGALLDKNNPGAGALMGATAGGLLGGGAGVAVARNNQSQAATEDSLHAQIQAAAKYAQNADAAAAEARQRSDAANQASLALAQQLRAGQITKAEYQSKINETNSYAQSVHTLIGHMSDKEALLRQEARTAGSAGGDLIQSADKISSDRASLQQSLTELSAAAGSVPVS